MRLLRFQLPNILRTRVSFLPLEITFSTYPVLAEFSVTIPEDLPSTCTVAGACAIQWYWYGASQTYENCVDFVIPA